MLHLKTKRTGIAALAYSPCGRWLAAAGTGGVHVWDLADPAAHPRHFPIAGRHNSAAAPAFLPDDRLFFFDRQQQAYHLTDLVTGADVARQASRSWHNRLLTVSADGRWLARAGGYVPPTVWTLAADGTCSAVWKLGNRRLCAAAFSPDSARLAVATRSVGSDADLRLAVHAADTGAVTHALTPYQYVTRLLFSPDGNTLVAGAGKGLAVYDLTAPDKKPTEVANPDPSHFRAAAFHPDGRRLATVSSDQVVRLWDTATWRPTAAYAWDIGKLAAVAFSPDGSTAATASSGGRVLVWDVDG